MERNAPMVTLSTPYHKDWVSPKLRCAFAPVTGAVWFPYRETWRVRKHGSTCPHYCFPATSLYTCWCYAVSEGAVRLRKQLGSMVQWREGGTCSDAVTCQRSMLSDSNGMFANMLLLLQRDRALNMCFFCVPGTRCPAVSAMWQCHK